jgi:Flp pilus assembly pilin Flp
MLKLFTFVQVAADSLRKHEEGQTMAEYGVVLAVITRTVIGAITLLSDNVRGGLYNVANVLPLIDRLHPARAARQAAAIAAPPIVG